MPIGDYTVHRRVHRASPPPFASRFVVNVSQAGPRGRAARGFRHRRNRHGCRRGKQWSKRRIPRSGRVVTGRELVDLPLNGRNFTQLGLLQTGVAPLTAGVATAGGSLRQGQAYAVNGMRPEQNVYLLDGAQNFNRMDGGYALKCRSTPSPSSGF
jgi:hypothetical protein